MSYSVSADTLQEALRQLLNQAAHPSTREPNLLDGTPEERGAVYCRSCGQEIFQYGGNNHRWNALDGSGSSCPLPYRGQKVEHRPR